MTGAPALMVERIALPTRAAPEHVSFVAATGTLTWITGENGAGKSTLLRMLARAKPAGGAVIYNPVPRISDITYYFPAMTPPLHTNVEDWKRLNHALVPPIDALLADDDRLFPAVSVAARMTHLSTGEAKRLLLWALLRRRSLYTILDEPYEHLSPTAKARLTDILLERAGAGVVIVATNQDIPTVERKQVIVIE